MKLFERLGIDQPHDAAAVAQQEYASNRSVALLIRPIPSELHIGSGTCVRLRDRYFIVTAAHNIPANSAAGLEVIPAGMQNQAALPIIGVGQLMKRDGLTIDVAYLEIEPAAARFSVLSWLGRDQLATVPAEAQASPYLIQGYPADQVKSPTARRPHFESDGLTTLSIPAARAAQGLQLGIDLALEWPPHDGSLDHLVIPEPPGVSGGGAWSVPKFSDHRVWSAELTKLVAINRCWSRGARELRGTLVPEWLALVESNYADVQE